MKIYKDMDIWMAVGSQHLYGEEALKKVAANTGIIADYIGEQEVIPAKIINRGVLTTHEEIEQFCTEASADPRCGGVMLWMHTFSPSQMWINGLAKLSKPILHLHTQFNRDIPWEEIDMDFMNLNQSAHGGREHGYINSRMKINRKVVVGYWKDEEVLSRIAAWIRAAAARMDLYGAAICRFGDNMRNVAVTEGDKVAAHIAFGYEVMGYGLADLGESMATVTDGDIDSLIIEYLETYTVAEQLKPGGESADSLREAARLEIGIERFLVKGGFKAFTTTFENLSGLAQLPGLACQRLMAKGYGFGAEGDWKTAALVRAMKVMGQGLGKGSAFMEDYTYHLDPENMLVLGSHMLEVCPSIAGKNEVRLECHPLGIGGKQDPVRMVFDVPGGNSLNASIMDMGNRFRLLVNEVQTLDKFVELPKLPVARVPWRPLPDLKTAAEAWILAGGAHHTGYSKDVTPEMLIDYASMCDMELLMINEVTKIEEFKKELKWNDLYYTVKAFSGNV